MTMQLNRVYKYRIYPTESQAQTLLRWLELNCCLYNWSLWWREGDYKRDGKHVTRSEQARALTQLKNSKPELREMPCSVLEDTVKRVDLAFKAFFRRIKGGQAPGYPRAKRTENYNSLTVGRSREFSLQCPGGRFARLALARDNSLKNATLTGLKVRMHRELPSDVIVRRVSIIREGRKWYANFGCETTQGVIDKPCAPVDPVGIDLGLKHFATLSSGEFIEAPRYLKISQAKLRRLQRTRSRRKKGSRRRNRARETESAMHRKIRDQRRDFLHNLSRKIVDEHDFVAVEKLVVKNMVKNHRLAQSISDAGWSGFISMLQYKAEELGKEVVSVDPKNTSQACSGCGEIVAKALSVRVHECPSCGLVLDRDLNAAINILTRAVQAQQALT